MDENTFYMKVAQNDETNPDTRSVRPPHTPSIPNTQLSPSGSFVRKHETPGILSRMFPPFASITYPCVRSPLAPCIALLYFVILCLLCIHCFFPLFSPVDYETDTAAAQFDYGVDDPSYLPELPGKPPLGHQISPTLLSTACIRVV